ncbi:LysR substrate-binding domain-containing protein [Lacimicrobium alkaliphilum]|uniref:LysR family transcriptional regulator n=1 Tax=Lacimicrobium alkaliphilum TaxID=1526571 RepID=A0ABQ1R539_9ALTE|nr:LysR family transcriptional regulator [Lacimicrobium alkaliphilum]GGD58296.1 LysR family transcriptional regulator [Lacimicrobium alkaliphilum]
MSTTTPSTQTCRSAVLPTLDPDMLRSFVAIAETGSMTKAARIVFRTPAAISMQVKKLEEVLQRKLLERMSRSIALTPDGELLLRYSRQLLKLNEELVSQFLCPRLNGKVTLGMPEQYGTHELPAILSQFAKSHPSVQVDVVLGKSIEIKQRFENGEIDLALVSHNLHVTPDTILKTVRLEKLVWAVNKNSNVIHQSSLPLALAEHGCPWRTLALEALDEAGIDYRIAYSSENCTGQLAAVMADLAVAAVPESLVKPPLKKLGHTNRLPEIGNAQTSLMLNSSASEVTLALKDFILQVLDPRDMKAEPSESENESQGCIRDTLEHLKI